jgi:hypothetical protein
LSQTAGTEAATTGTGGATSQTSTDTGAATATDTGTDAGKQAEIDWKAKARDWEKRAKANAEAATKLAQLEESQKTEAQKLADRAAQAEKERDEARLDALRMKVGASKKLPADVIDLLKGDTEEELSAHADRLAEHFKASVRPSGSADQGARGVAPTAGPAQEFADFLKNQLRQ